MNYRLWIDDDAFSLDVESWRSPPKKDTDWIVARSSAEAIGIITLFGNPRFIEFDHDLGMLNGKPDTAMEFLKWYAHYYPDAIQDIMGFNVHSLNLQGAENIKAFMKGWKRIIDD